MIFATLILSFIFIPRIYLSIRLLGSLYFLSQFSCQRPFWGYYKKTDTQQSGISWFATKRKASRSGLSWIKLEKGGIGNKEGDSRPTSNMKLVVRRRVSIQGRRLLIYSSDQPRIVVLEFSRMVELEKMEPYY